MVSSKAAVYDSETLKPGGSAFQLRHVGFSGLRLAGGAVDEFKEFPEVFFFRQFRFGEISPEHQTTARCASRLR